LGCLGECRTLQLVGDGDLHTKNSGADYRGAAACAEQKTTLDWALHHLSFRDYRDDKMAQSRVREIYREYPFELIFCNFFRTSGAACFDLAACIIDTDAIPEDNSNLMRLLRPLTQNFMRRRAAMFDGVFVIRESDRRLLAPVESDLLPALASRDIAPLSPGDDARNLLFVGSTRWGPNADAAKFLAEKLAPAIYQTAPELKVRLVGEGTDAIAPRPGLSTGGFVDDLAEEYKNARLVMCPVWSGGGANVKLAEAIQYGAACAASAYAAAGFETMLTPGEDLMVSATPEEFVKDVCALAVDPVRTAALRRSARHRARDALSHAHFEDVLIGKTAQCVSTWNEKRAAAGARLG
jgi:hypothetical protein